MLHLGQIKPGLDRRETCRHAVRFGQAAAEWGQAGNDGSTAVARRNSVRDPPENSVNGGGRSPGELTDRARSSAICCANHNQQPSRTGTSRSRYIHWLLAGLPDLATA